jgi:hypothetical protein
MGNWLIAVPQRSIGDIHLLQIITPSSKPFQAPFTTDPTLLIAPATLHVSSPILTGMTAFAVWVVAEQGAEAGFQMLMQQVSIARIVYSRLRRLLKPNAVERNYTSNLGSHNCYPPLFCYIPND